MIPCLIPAFKGSAFISPSVHILLAICLLYIAFSMPKYSSLISIFLKIIKVRCALSKVFCIYLDDMQFLFSSLFMPYIY